MKQCDDVLVMSRGTMYSGIGFGLFLGITNLMVSTLSHRRRLVLLIIFTVSITSCVLLNVVHHPIANLIFFVLIQWTSIAIGIGGSYFVDMFPTVTGTYISFFVLLEEKTFIEICDQNIC